MEEQMVKFEQLIKFAQMIEVSKKYFQDTILELDVLYTPFEYTGQWELRNGKVIARESTGYKNSPFCSWHTPTRYYVLPEYAPKTAKSDQ